MKLNIKRVSHHALFIALIIMVLVLSVGPGRAGDRKNPPGQEKTSSLEKIKKQFPHRKKISCKKVKHSYRMFYLDKDIYRYAQDELADLRIFDEKGGSPPYYIDYGVIEYLKKDVAYQTKMITRHRDAETGDTTFDFQVIPGRRGERPRVDTMKLAVNKALFSKKVIIYGRYADAAWQQLKLDTIYHFDSYEKEEVEAGGWDYNFYRIKIEDNWERLEVTRLSLTGSKGATGERFTDTTSLAFEQKQEGSKTIIVIKNPDRLKIFSLNLSIEGVFKRDFRLYIEEELRYKNSTRKPRTVQMTITEGELYSFDFNDVQVSHTAIGLYNYAMQKQMLFLTIKNNSDSPLKINAIEGTYYKDRVVFKSIPGREYTLYYGNPSASRPVYDTALHRLNSKNERKDLCMCQEVTSNEVAESSEGIESIEITKDDSSSSQLPPPASDSENRPKPLFIAVILFIVLLLTFFLVRYIKIRMNR